MQYLTVAELPSGVEWGPQSMGLRLSLGLTRASTRVGDPIIVNIYLENLGPDRDIFLPCAQSTWYTFRIVDTDGGLIERKTGAPLVCSWSPTHSEMKHDEVIKSTLDLKDRYLIANAGTYIVTAESTIHLPAIAWRAADGKPTYVFPILTSLISNDVTLNVRSLFP